MSQRKSTRGTAQPVRACEGATPSAAPRTAGADGGNFERGRRRAARSNGHSGALERRSLAHQVEERIKELILSGRLACGERISEEGLAEQFRISRTPIREALRALENYGLVRIKPRSFAQVEQITIAEARQVAEVRAQLEALAARRLAARATAEDVRALKERADRCAARLAAGDRAKAFEADSAFHLEIAARCGNPFLHETLQRLDAFVMLYRLTFCRTLESVAGNVKLHARIISAIARHDADAAGKMVTEHALSMGKG